jgi:hypothetical protein
MTTIETEFKQHLQAIGACADAREWVGDRTAKQAWDECLRADWLLWWVARDRGDAYAAIAGAVTAANAARPKSHANSCSIIRQHLTQPWTETGK